MPDNRWLEVPVYPRNLRDQWLGQIAAALATAMPDQTPEFIAGRACDITLALLKRWRDIPPPPEGIPHDTAESLALKRVGDTVSGAVHDVADAVRTTPQMA